MRVRLAALLAVLLLLGPTLPARPQQHGPIARVGVLAPLSLKESGPEISAFREGLREHGYVDGQNIAIEWRWAQGNVRRFPDLAADLARLNVDVIVASVNPAIQAARAATPTIPIVMVVPADPVGLGFVRNLARPGGNITGLTWPTREMVPKRLQLLKDALPTVSHVAVLWDPIEPERRLHVQEAEQASSPLGLLVQPFEVRSGQQLHVAFAAMAQARVDAVLVEASATLAAHRVRLADLALKHRLPTIGWWRGMAEAGCLLSYSPSLTAQYRRGAYFVARILKGTNPADLPVEPPTTYEIIVNLKTAKTLGLALPPWLLAQADEVIQ